MTMFRRVLVAYDGSREAEKALQFGIQWCREHEGARLDVIYVYYNPSLIFGEALVTAPLGLEAEYYNHARSVAKQAEELVAELPYASVELKSGIPGKTILEHAKDMNNDVIVIGNRGHSKLREMMLGSVSHHVAQHAHVPVLVMR
jgi:nucleotide-binding universal stress UspA family protein